jgi:hypothetical protein
MTEEELRAALRSTMTATLMPPSMSAVETIGRARRTRIRRRAAWLGSGAAGAVAVVAVAVGVTAAGRPVGLVAGGPPPSAVPTPAGSPVTMPPPSTEGKQVWPTGPDGSPQEDRTARAGAQYDKGTKLLSDLVRAVPAGYDVPAGALDTYHQAQFEDRIGGKDIWSYQAYARITKDGGSGRVAVEVHAAGNRIAGNGCELTRTFWGMGGHCRVVTVNGVQIGVVDRPENDNRFDQWAAYRYADGTVVFVAQSRMDDDGTGSASSPLTALPYTVDQLAALTTNAPFHIG